MKKIVAFLLVLAIAVPAMATVNFTAVDNGSGQLKISYASDASEAPRGIALKIALTNGATCSPTGGVVSSDAAFNTYIDYAWSAGSGYTIGSGHPLAIDGTRGPLTGAAGTFVVCMGVLDTTGNQAGGPTSTTNLITLQLVGTGSTVATISADTLRGPASGVVGSTLASNLPLAGVTVSFACTVTPPTAIAAPDASATDPGIKGGDINASLGFTTSGATDSGSHPIQYRFDWGDGSPLSTWGTGSDSHIYTADGSYVIKSQARCSVTLAESTWYTGPTVYIGCIMATAGVEYTDWVAWGRPSCWCFRRQCRGDADGVKIGSWVGIADVTAFAASYFKTDAVLATVNVGGVKGICCDLDHKKVGARVSTADVTEFAKYYFKPDATITQCPKTTINFWKN